MKQLLHSTFYPKRFLKAEKKKEQIQFINILKAKKILKIILRYTRKF